MIESVRALTAGSGTWQETTEHTSGQVRLYESLVAPWALPFDRLVPPPIGLSLFAVGRPRVHAA